MYNTHDTDDLFFVSMIFFRDIFQGFLSILIIITKIMMVIITVMMIMSNFLLLSFEEKKKYSTMSMSGDFDTIFLFFFFIKLKNLKSIKHLMNDVFTFDILVCVYVSNIYFSKEIFVFFFVNF